MLSTTLWEYMKYMLVACAMIHTQVMWAQADTVSARFDYPSHVVFLPKEKIDSPLVYANTNLIPVVFKVNKYVLHPNEQLDSLVALIERVKSDPRVKLAYVWIGGSASPEGPVKWNKQLGHYRSEALHRFLVDNTTLDDSLIRVENLWEDWYSTERALQRIDFPHKQQILDIISEEADYKKRKQRIKAIDNEKTWWKLINEVFPPFRNARMVIVCHEEFQPVSLPLTPTEPVAVKPVVKLNPIAPHPSPRPALRLTPPREDRFYAVKTNTLFIAALTANIGFEAELWRHWSIDAPFWYSPYDIVRPTRKLRLLATQPELRWWTGEKAGEGHFIGAHLHVVGFNVAINDHGRYQDPNHALFGGGIGYGYAHSFGKAKQWLFEMNIGVGYADFKYDVYRNWYNGPRYIKGIHSHYWGVTRAGVNIGYKWYKDRKQRKTRR